MKDFPAKAPVRMSEPHEDTLETIWLLQREHGAARVRDIAKARGVSAATVSISLARLSTQGLVNYARRESVSLTPRGERAARRVFSRHRLLARLFGDVLGMSPRAAGEQACALEHALTGEAMDRVARFLELAGTCPSVREPLARCPLAAGPGEAPRCRPSPACRRCPAGSGREARSVADLRPGQHAVVARIRATTARRRRLLDLGVLPGSTIGVEPSAPRGRALRVVCQGAPLALRRDEAACVLVRSGRGRHAPDGRPPWTR